MAVRLNATYARRTSGLPSKTAYTIAFWYMRVGAGTTQPIVSLEDNTAGSPGYYHSIWVDPNVSGVSLDGQGGESSRIQIMASYPTQGSWYYVVLAGDVTNFYGGIFAPTTAISLTSYQQNGAFTPLGLGIGRSTAWPTDADQRVAGLKVWNVKLTDAELEVERRSIRPVTQLASLNSWHPMFADTKDYSGLAGDFTETGSLTYEDGPPIGWGASPLSVGATVPGFTVAQASPIAATASVLVPSTRILYPGSVIPTITL